MTPSAPRTPAGSLRQSNSLLSTFADHLPGLVAYWNSDLRCEFANHAYLEWFGRDLAQMHGISMRDLLGEELFLRNEPYIRAVLAGEDQRFERVLTKTDGSVRSTWAQYIAHRVDGAVRGFFVLVTDVTEIKQDQQRLRVNDLAIRAVSQGVIISDAVQTVISVNAAFTAITGYEACEIIGRSCSLLQGAGSDRQTVELIRQAIRRGEDFSGEILNYRKDGTPFWNELTISPARDPDGRLCNFIGIIRDVTERKQAETRQRMDTLFRCAADAIIVSDRATGTVLDANRQAEALLGMSRDDLHGLHIDRIHPRELRNGMRGLLDGSTDGPGRRIQGEVLHRDGSRIPVEIGCSVMALPTSGSLVMGIYRDIRERVRLETENRRLEQLSSLGLLAGGIAHDVRNCLAGIIGISDHLRVISQDPHIRSCADMLDVAGSQANQLCDELVRFARRGSEKPEAYEVQAAITTALSVFRTSGRGVRIEMVQQQPARHQLYGNRSMLHHAILNLCLNARDAMDGRGTIRIQESCMELQADGCTALLPYQVEPGPYLRLSVNDHGCGMDAETVRRCCEPLFTTKGERGSGLGLASVRRAVLDHHGALQIDSTPGVGTTITLLLPLHGQVQAKPSPRPPPGPAGPATAAGPVLVVDDEPLLRANMVELLEASGYRAVGLPDGLDAVNWCQAHPRQAAAILLDLTMEHLGGEAAIDPLRAIDPDVPIFIISAESFPSAQRRGATRVIPKPIRADVLLEALASALSADRPVADSPSRATDVTSRTPAGANPDV